MKPRVNPRAQRPGGSKSAQGETLTTPPGKDSSDKDDQPGLPEGYTIRPVNLNQQTPPVPRRRSAAPAHTGDYVPGRTEEHY